MGRCRARFGSALGKGTRLGLPGTSRRESGGDHADAIADTIAATPASGPIGLAIKIYLLVYNLDEWARDDPAGLSAQKCDRFHEDGNFFTEIVRDAVRFVPELEPLAGPALTPAR